MTKKRKKPQHKIRHGAPDKAVQSEANVRDTAKKRFWTRFLPELLLVAAVSLAYGNSLSNDFVHDDRVEILKNPYVQDLALATKIFTKSAWAFRAETEQATGSNYYRPIQYLIYGLIYQGFGPTAWVFHLFKLLLHLLVCVLFYRLIRRFWLKSEPALICALLFALHPVNTEAVTWISGVTDVLCALFFLAALWFFLLDRETPGPLRILAMTSCFVLGMFSKETMIAILPVLFTYLWVTEGGAPSGRTLARYFGPTLAGLLVYLILRIQAIGGFTESTHVRYEFLTVFQVFLNQVHLLEKYVQTFVFPLSLNAYHLFDPILKVADLRFIVSSLFLVLLCGGLRLAAWRFRIASGHLMTIGLVWFVAALLPVLVFLKRIGENVLAERYLYLPGLGLVLAIAVLLSPALGRRRLIVWSGATLLLTAFLLKDIERNRVWRDDLTFYETTLQASRGSSTLLNNLGVAYAARLRYQDALRAFEQSLAVRPNWDAFKNLAPLYAAMGRLDEAEETYHQAIALNSKDASVFSGLGDLLFAKQDYPKAIDAYKKALELTPNNQRVMLNLGDALMAVRQYNEALSTYGRVAALGSLNAARAYRGVSAAYTALNRPDEAAKAMQAARAAR
ncbi:MAG: tetratricopeptide repeat protein [Acidobacteriota bacterium]